MTFRTCGVQQGSMCRPQGPAREAFGGQNSLELSLSVQRRQGLGLWLDVALLFGKGPSAQIRSIYAHMQNYGAKCRNHNHSGVVATQKWSQNGGRCKDVRQAMDRYIVRLPSCLEEIHELGGNVGIYLRTPWF